jgi:hypothetical protein
MLPVLMAMGSFLIPYRRRPLFSRPCHMPACVPPLNPKAMNSILYVSSLKKLPFLRLFSCASPTALLLLLRSIKAILPMMSPIPCCVAYLPLLTPKISSSVPSGLVVLLLMLSSLTI